LRRSGVGYGRASDTVGNQDSLQRGLRLSLCIHNLSLPLVFGPLETRTRFKEDCDSYRPPLLVSDRLGGWKPGLASKRIATLWRSIPGASNPGWKPGLASKRIATCVVSLVFTHLSGGVVVGNQDSLQRGLRPRRRRVIVPPSFPRWRLETRTRFKEDCDRDGDVDQNPLSIWIRVGNQDSLQRGLRLWPERLSH
jgi:hypothetical protein